MCPRGSDLAHVFQLITYKTEGIEAQDLTFYDTKHDFSHLTVSRGVVITCRSETTWINVG